MESWLDTAISWRMPRRAYPTVSMASFDHLHVSRGFALNIAEYCATSAVYYICDYLIWKTASSGFVLHTRRQQVFGPWA